MQGSFTKGLFIGSVIGASISIMMKNSDMMNPRARKRMMRGGHAFLRRSGSIIGDVIDMFR